MSKLFEPFLILFCIILGFAIIFGMFYLGVQGIEASQRRRLEYEREESEEREKETLKRYGLYSYKHH